MGNLFLGLIIMFSTLKSTTIREHNMTNPPLVVLELFTSQGCSSCPPADRLLEKVKNENGNHVIALSYHVDYWNYIGWKDPFSRASFSSKQRKYGNKFYSSSIYTPQIVVNGKEHFVGSNARIMQNKLQHYSSKPPAYSVKVSKFEKEGNNISFNYETEGDGKGRTLRLALVIKERITQIKRGENRNRTLTNTNIVVEEAYLKLEHNKGIANLTIPDIVEKNDELALVVLVESSNMDILGGTQIDL